MLDNIVSYHHIRNVGKRKKDNYTLAIIPTKDTIFVGIAKCSKLDNFVKAKGRQIAFGRAQCAAETYSDPKWDRDVPKWSLCLDRTEFDLLQPKIKREVINITTGMLSAIARDEHSIVRKINSSIH